VPVSCSGVAGLNWWRWNLRCNAGCIEPKSVVAARNVNGGRSRGLIPPFAAYRRSESTKYGLSEHPAGGVIVACD